MLTPAYVWDKVQAMLQTPAAHGYDKAYLTGTTGDDTLTAYGNPRTTYPSGMAPGMARLTGTGYTIDVMKYDEVYANLLTGNDTANLYDSTGPGTDTFWGNLHDAVLSDGTLNLTNGNLLTTASYYYRAYGFDSDASDRVNLFGSAIGGTNQKKVIAPLDYILATYGTWTDAP